MHLRQYNGNIKLLENNGFGANICRFSLILRVSAFPLLVVHLNAIGNFNIHFICIDTNIDRFRVFLHVTGFPPQFLGVLGVNLEVIENVTFSQLTLFHSSCIKSH